MGSKGRLRWDRKGPYSVQTALSSGACHHGRGKFCHLLKRIGGSEIQGASKLNQIAQIDGLSRDIEGLIKLGVLQKDAGGGRSTSYSLATSVCLPRSSNAAL